MNAKLRTAAEISFWCNGPSVVFRMYSSSFSCNHHQNGSPPSSSSSSSSYDDSERIFRLWSWKEPLLFYGLCASFKIRFFFSFQEVNKSVIIRLDGNFPINSSISQFRRNKIDNSNLLTFILYWKYKKKKKSKQCLVDPIECVVYMT